MEEITERNERGQVTYYRNSNGYEEWHEFDEFVCDKLDTYNFHEGLTQFGGELGLPIATYGSYLIFEDDYKAMCLSYNDVKNYGKGKTLYGLHISELKIYDNSKELREFWHECKSYDGGCDNWYDLCGIAQNNGCHCGLTRLNKAPQSWCYVEGMEE